MIVVMNDQGAAGGPPAGPGAPPPGPGVRPPFPAAPTEGRTARLWLSLGVAGAVLLLCCGAGAVALGGFFGFGFQALNEQAQVAVGDYLDAVVEGDYRRAYDLRCSRDRREESLAEFTGRVTELGRVESYRLGDLDISQSDLALPADVTYADGRRERLQVPLAQDQSTGELEVCGFNR